MRSNYVTDRSCWQCGRGYVHCRPPRPATGTNLNCAVLWEGRWHAMADQRLLPMRRKTVSDRKAVCAREAYRRRARHGMAGITACMSPVIRVPGVAVALSCRSQTTVDEFVHRSTYVR